MVLYVDIMLAINFSMDFLALFICSLLLHLKVNKLRILLSSLIGSIYGVVQVLLDLNLTATVLLSGAFAVIMISIAFSVGKISNICFYSIVFVFVNMMLGGIMSLLYSFMNRILGEIASSYTFEGNYSAARIFIIISLTTIAAIVFSRMLIRKKDIKTVEINLKINEENYMLTGLCDSGNLLTDPLSGKKVILISAESKAGIEITRTSELFKKYIPYKDINGEGVLKGIIPKRLLINGVSTNAIIATVKNESFDGYDAIVPSGLV